MALDIGDRRIGVALSDETGTVADPFAVVDRARDTEATKEIARMIVESYVGEVVAGIPSSPEGREGVQAAKVLRFVNALRRRVPVPVLTWDESWSSRRADEIRRSSGKRWRTKGERDKVAAAVILEEFLEYRRRGREERRVKSGEPWPIEGKPGAIGPRRD